jgi:hypothetical protein
MPTVDAMPDVVNFPCTANVPIINSPFADIRALSSAFVSKSKGKLSLLPIDGVAAPNVLPPLTHAFDAVALSVPPDKDKPLPMETDVRKLDASRPVMLVAVPPE